MRSTARRLITVFFIGRGLALIALVTTANSGTVSRACGWRAAGIWNMSPLEQPFTVSDPIPANTTYLRGNYYNAAKNSIERTGTIAPDETQVSQFWVTVNAGTPSGTVIKNEAELSDDTLGSSASATTTVINSSLTPP